jgi:tetratricopeptide (TPR) repeat protein
LDEATRSYAAGGELARRIGDRHSERLSRIGRAIVLQKLGNLPESEKMLREVLADASRDGDRDAEARSRHDLAATLSHQGRAAEAVPLVYQAFCLYERVLDRQRALSDLGMALKRLGHYRAAEDAFHVVLSCQGSPVIRVNTMLELLEISAATRNRVSFERWRRDLGALEESMPPEVRVEYEIELGRGFAAFGQLQRGAGYLEAAIRRAEGHKLNECLFRAEAALNGLAKQPEPPTETVGWADDPAVSDVANELHQLRVVI